MLLSAEFSLAAAPSLLKQELLRHRHASLLTVTNRDSARVSVTGLAPDICDAHDLGW